MVNKRTSEKSTKADFSVYFPKKCIYIIQCCGSFMNIYSMKTKINCEKQSPDIGSFLI